MSPENVEWGRRLRPCEEDARGGLGRPLVAPLSATNVP